MSNNYTNPAEEENFSFDKNKRNPFGMPEGYFDSFANKIKHKIELVEELKEFTALSAIAKQTAFVVPENYFAQNENELEQQYELQAYPLLNKIAKPELKSITKEYFEVVQNKVTLKIALAEELKQYATLYSIEKQNNFIVAPDYFDTIAERVKEVYHSGKEERGSIIEITFAFLFRPKVALAYSTVLLIGAAAFFYFNNPETISTGDCKTLACLERRELLNEKNVNEFSDEDLYEMIDVDQLDKQLSGEEEEADTITNKKTEQ